MTELEKIAYAKTFIDKLANGINPIDGSEVQEGDIVNNVRLSRCFFYVSGILGQVIDNGGISPAPVKAERKSRKKPYSISQEQAERFEYSDRPIPATEIINRIVAIGPTEGVKRLPKRNLMKWLAYLDLVEEVSFDGRRIRRPTPSGEELGIFMEERRGQYGVYHVMLFNLEAQRFVIDNIEAMLSLDSKAYREKMNLDNQGKSWDRDQDDMLVGMFMSGRSVAEIAKSLKRGEKAVLIRLRNKGLISDVSGSYSVNSARESVMPTADKAPEEIAVREASEERSGAEETAIEAVSQETASVKEISVEEKITCMSCKFARSGECFPQQEICRDYERAYDVPKSEREAWPEMGDASYLRQNGRHR